MLQSESRRASSPDLKNGVTKRVVKACDRCRLKKSKCNGSHPCTRCKADNTICIFAERKKVHVKTYPKGYVELLEQQQAQLVAALQKTYRRLLDADLWPGKSLSEARGQPLTHEMLARLDLLEPRNEGSGEHAYPKENCRKLQQRPTLESASFIAERSSIGSRSNHGIPRKRTRTDSHSSIYSASLPHVATVFEEDFVLHQSASPPLVSQSPVLELSRLQSSIKPAPIHDEAIENDNFLMLSWRDQFWMCGLSATDLIRPKAAVQEPALQAGYQAAIVYNNTFGPQLEHNSMVPFSHPACAAPAKESATSDTQDWMNEPIEVDFSEFLLGSR